MHLAAVGGVGVEIVQYAPGRAEIAQTLNFIGAEGDLIIFSVAVQVGGLDERPVVFPVLDGYGAFQSKLVQPVGADDIRDVARGRLIQHGKIVNVAVRVGEGFLHAVALVHFRFQVRHAVFNVIIQRQDHARFAVFQHIRHRDLHDDVGQFRFHHHKVQAFGVIFLRGIVKFKVDVEHLTHHLEYVHLVHGHLMGGLAAEYADCDAFALRGRRAGGGAAGGRSRRCSGRRAGAACKHPGSQRQGEGCTDNAFHLFHVAFLHM